MSKVWTDDNKRQGRDGDVEHKPLEGRELLLVVGVICLGLFAWLVAALYGVVL